MLSAMMACSLVACSSSKAGVSGEFTGTAKGLGGDVNVTLTLKDSVITDVKAEEKDETEGIGTKALDKLSGEMVSGNTINVEGVSGATVTSDAIKEAAKEALKSAGLNPDDYATAAEAKKEEDITKDADLVVVGAGMTSAIVAAQAGKSVVILESQSAAGGNSVRATGGFGANNDMVAEQNPDLKGYITTNAAGAQGQGITMATAEDVGAGEGTGGVHGANRLGGNAVAYFIVFGRIAGQQAADYIG